MSPWAVQAALSALAVLLADVETVAVRRLGFDDHRYRSVRYYRRPDATVAPARAVDIDPQRLLQLACCLLTRFSPPAEQAYSTCADERSSAALQASWGLPAGS